MNRPLNTSRIRPNPGQGAFTLVEMLVVVVIIAILLCLLIGVFGYAREAARRAKARGELEMLQNAALEYSIRYGSYPTNTPSVAYDVVGFWTSSHPLTNWVPTGITGRDPWQTSYKYVYVNEFACHFYSLGRKTNTADVSDNIYSGSGMR